MDHPILVEAVERRRMVVLESLLFGICHNYEYGGHIESCSRSYVCCSIFAFGYNAESL
jgi:hypothetical protein